MKGYYISKYYKDQSSAGNKAKRDIEIILEREGIKNLGLPCKIGGNGFTRYFYTLASVCIALFRMPRKGVVFLQYPLKKYYNLVCRFAHFKKAKVVTIIHDLGSFRRAKLTIEEEIRRLNRSDYIIAHNDSMKRWLEEQGCMAKIGSLGVFDYLSETEVDKEHVVGERYALLYAGGLSKRHTSFLYDMAKFSTSVLLNLYGNGFDAEEAEGTCMDYKGFLPSDQLIEKADGDFGLVWYGDSIDDCTGVLREYLKYINPHKVSLYIRCRLPLIIWDQSAMADFVKENGIGILVKSLTELDERLKQITPDEYRQMRENTYAIEERIKSGYYMSQAVGRALSELL